MSGYGFGPGSAAPASGLPWHPSPAVILPYRLALESPVRSLVLAIDIESYDEADGLAWTRVATEGFTTGAGHDPASTAYEGRVASGLVVSRQIGGDGFGRLAGVVGRVFGALPLINADGGLDALAERAVDGRRVVVRAGVAAEDREARRSVDISTFGRIVETSGDAWGHGRERLTLSLRDSLARYRTAVQSVRYAGTGGAEGPATLAGKTKPLTWGRCRTVPAVLVDAGRQIYQVHDGAIHALDAVYDRGIELEVTAEIAGGYTALVAASVPAGEVTAALDAGMFRLGSPPAGAVTADLRGGLLNDIIVYIEPWDDGDLWDDFNGWSDTAEGPGYVETVGQIMLAAVMRTGRFGLDVIDGTSLDELDRVQPAPVGIHIPSAGESPSLEDVLGQLALGVGAVIGPDRLGRTQALRIDGPRSTTPVVLTDAAIVDIRRVDLAYGVPPLGWSILCRRNWAGAARDSDLAAGVSDERRAELLQPGLTAVAEDNARIVRHPTAKLAGVVQGHFAELADAEAEAERLIGLYAPGRIMLEVIVKYLGSFTLGRTVEIRHGRYGLAEGRRFVVVGIREEYGANRTTLRLFG